MEDTRILSRKVLPRQSLVDDGHPRFRCILGIVKESSAHEFCLQRREIAGANIPVVHFIVLAMERFSDNADPVGVAVVTDWQQGR